MYANEAPLPIADRSIHVERQAPLPRIDPSDPGETTMPEDEMTWQDEEQAPEEAGYGHGV